MGRNGGKKGVTGTVERSYHGTRLQEAAEQLVRWCGSKRGAANAVGVSFPTINNWLEGNSAKATGFAAKRLAMVMGSIEEKVRKIRGLATAYMAMIYNAAPERLKMSMPREVLLQRVNCLAVQFKEPSKNEMVLSMVDFQHNRERFACIVCAAMFPDLSKREVWALVKLAVFGGAKAESGSMDNVKVVAFRRSCSR